MYPMKEHALVSAWCRPRSPLWALIVLFAGLARGQAPVPTLPPPTPLPAAPSHPLGLADLENLAVSNNPTLAGARSLVQQEQGLWQQAGLYPNPSAGYIRTDPDKSGQSETQGIFLSQDIVTAGKLRLGQDVQTREIETRDWQVKAQLGRILNDVRIRYYEVLGAQETVQTARELERLATEGVHVAQQRIQAKLGTRPDLLQAEIQLNLVQTTVQDARYRHEAAWKQLAHVVGTLNLQPAPLAGRLEDNLPPLDWQQSLQQLLADSPVLKAQQAQVDSARKSVQLARAQAVPNVSVQLLIQHDQYLKYDSVTSLVSLPIPIFNRNQGNITNAEGQLVQQQKEYDRVQLALADQLAGAFQTYQSARTQSERLQKEILPRARENLDLSTQAYQAGQFDFLHVLTARQTYFQARLAYIEALTSLHKVIIEIVGLELLGGLNPTEIGTALQTQPGMGGAGARNVLLQQLQQERGGASRTLPGAVTGGER